MNDDDNEIGGGGRVDPDALPDKGHIEEPEPRKWLTGRRARRAHRRGYRYDKPQRSRCQRKTTKQRAFRPSGKAMERKARRRAARAGAAEQAA